MAYKITSYTLLSLYLPSSEDLVANFQDDARQQLSLVSQKKFVMHSKIPKMFFPLVTQEW